MNEYVIRTNSVSKVYGQTKVVKQMSINVPKGSIYGLIGKNGAGKTSLMKMLTGLSEKTEGDIILFDEENKPASFLQRRVGALIESPGIFNNMSAFDNLKMKAIGMGVYKKQAILDILKLVGLDGVGSKKVKQFSLGMKQRLGVGLALVGSPDLLILDEPINGLDPQGIVEMRHILERLNHEKNITILVSSHILEELYKIVTHVGIINKGELIAELTKEEIDEKCRHKLILKTTNSGKTTAVLEEIGIKNYTVISEDCIYVYEGMDRIPDINLALTKEEIGVLELSISSDSLEDFFISMTEEK